MQPYFDALGFIRRALQESLKISAQSHPTTGSKYGDSRPILLVHGFASTEAMLAPLARHLSRTLRRKVVRVRLGAGRENLRTSAATLQSVLAECATHPDFEHADIVAHSMGGLTALYLLKKLDFPDKILKGKRKNVLGIDVRSFASFEEP